MWICPDCESTNEDNLITCEVCGAARPVAEPETAREPELEVEKPAAAKHPASGKSDTSHPATKIAWHIRQPERGWFKIGDTAYIDYVVDGDERVVYGDWSERYHAPIVWIDESGDILSPRPHRGTMMMKLRLAHNEFAIQSGKICERIHIRAYEHKPKPRIRRKPKLSWAEKTIRRMVMYGERIKKILTD